MRLNIENRSVRYLAAGAEFLLVLVTIFGVAKVFLAQREAQTNDAAHLEVAIRLDPGNAEYHIQLGRLFEYVPTSIRPEEAAAEFQQAAQLSPYNPEAWINLAAASEFAGRISKAEQYLRQADSLAPRQPSYQWPIANFFLLHGNVRESFLHFKIVLVGTRQYDSAIFETAWKASGDPNFILQLLIPSDLKSEFSYLYYLVGTARWKEALAVWARILSTPGSFSAQDASSYIESLINAHDSEAAFKVWTDLRNRGLIPFSSAKSGQDLITDGDFEVPLLNLGFGWRIAAEPDVYAGLDESTFRSAGHSLLVQFTGKENLNYGNVFQYVKVEPLKHYQLRAFLKTEGITTDSGPRLEVRDAYNPGALDVFSEGMSGSSGGWIPVSLEFQTPAKTDLVIMALRRLPSQKFDNLIAGKVWLDDVELTPGHP